MVGHARHVQHERAAAEVEVSHRVERVLVGRHDDLVAGGGEVALVAELVDRRVGEVVGDGDARLRLRLAQELEQRRAVDVGVGARLLGLRLAERRGGTGRGDRGQPAPTDHTDKHQPT
jgi:hypothetical protein